MSSDTIRLLVVDSYDSFTHNLAALCQKAIPDARITIIKNDDFTLTELLPYLKHFSAVIVGPGPGSPDIEEDIGLVKDLWALHEHDVIPIFGVCLGLQSLAIQSGGRIKRLGTVKHGQMSQIEHRGIDLFAGVESIRAVRYHSLHVEVDENNHVEELAWAEDIENGRVVMAIRHKERPYWAVQYHPESVCTEGGGIHVLSNFWTLAQGWSKMKARSISPWTMEAQSALGHVYTWPRKPLQHHHNPSTSSDTVLTSSLTRHDLSVVDICEIFGASHEEAPFVLLDSAANPGRYSILGVLSESTPRITFRLGDGSVAITTTSTSVSHDLHGSDIWTWLASFIHARKATGGNKDLPFWGGFMGFLTYELGVQTLGVPCRNANRQTIQKHPDVNFVFVERSIVVDTQTGEIFAQSIIPDDEAWVADTIERLKTLQPTSSPGGELEKPRHVSVTLPDKDRYISRIEQAKERLFAGDSYELCLTAQTRIKVFNHTTTHDSTSWQRYKRLRRSNPAPHSAYLRLHPSTLLSSSPERFLSVSRPPNPTCQLRPIKGTIRKGPGITRALAEQALIGSPKEVAENLMIVDLIRHDLHGVVGNDVEVKQFCAVEEYETVWQLVSVIEGKLSPGSSKEAEEQLGWQALKHSLPPGSMTGAPKKRSVEILQTLEDGERSVYSGVFGYWCVSGKSDWSVTIRSCFKYEDSCASRPSDHCEEWLIGAGGAITALSDAEGEWDEMLVKLQSVLRSFDVI